MVEQGNTVAHGQGFLLVMSHVDHGETELVAELADLQLQGIPQVAVERAERLVHEEQAWPTDDGTRESNALLLPHVMAWNKMACVERMQDIAQAFGLNITHLSADEAADQAVAAMARLCAAVEIPQGLRSFGVPQEAIPAMALEAAGIERLMRNNPRQLTALDIEKIYRAAY